jgi:hypothetical protein
MRSLVMNPPSLDLRETRDAPARWIDP